MTEQELIQENEKLNARLQKAVTVFAEQKATIERLTAERDAAVAKTAEAGKQDELFFEQQGEIENLKAEVQTKASEVGDLNTKLEKAREAFKQQAEEIAANKKNIEEQANTIATLNSRNTLLVNTLTQLQDLVKTTIEQM